MSPLVLYHEETEPALSVPLWFIKEYMPAANGDFVKVYLYLQLVSLQADAALSVADLADHLSFTESDVIRALRYWDAAGLIRLTADEDGLPAEIAFLSPKKADAAAEKKPARRSSRAARVPAAQAVTVTDTEEFRQLLMVIEQYLGTTLSSHQVQVVQAWYQHTNENADLIDYLVEYCVGLKEPDKPSFDYMNAVLTAWQEEGITSADQARREMRVSREEASAYLRAMGSGRKRLTTEEREYLGRARRSYGMPMDLLVFAAEQTAQHEARFPYFAAIVEAWHDKGVRSLEEAKRLSDEHRAQGRTQARTSKPRRTSFNNFEQRENAGQSWNDLQPFRAAEAAAPADPEEDAEMEAFRQSSLAGRRAARQRKNA